MKRSFGNATVVREPDGGAVRVSGANADITDLEGAKEELVRRARQQAGVAQLGLSGGRVPAAHSQRLVVASPGAGLR
jgi:hypothetical protein